MADQDTRTLERRWRETKSAQDLAAWLRERIRLGELEGTPEPCPVCGNSVGLVSLMRQIRKAGGQRPTKPLTFKLPGTKGERQRANLANEFCGICGTEWLLDAHVGTAQCIQLLDRAIAERRGRVVESVPYSEGPWGKVQVLKAGPFTNWQEFTDMLDHEGVANTYARIEATINAEAIEAAGVGETIQETMTREGTRPISLLHGWILRETTGDTMKQQIVLVLHRVQRGYTIEPPLSINLEAVTVPSARPADAAEYIRDILQDRPSVDHTEGLAPPG